MAISIFSTMDPRLSEIAETLAEDAASGASEMHASILNSLLASSDADLSAIPTSEWEDFSVAIHRAKPSIAPVFNIANMIMLMMEQGTKEGGSLRQALMEMLERERKSGTRISEHAAKLIKGRWFMTTSYSGTVAQVLKAMAKTRRIKVTVAESSPGGEGRQFAKLLADQGMEAEVIYDSTVFARMEHLDGAIVGADSVTASGLVNKVGTRALAEAARAHDLNAYAVCGWSKICPVVLSDLSVSSNSLGKRLTEHVQVFESAPLELFSHIITDQGSLSSADLRMELKVRKVARAWYSRGVLQRTD
jgi:translation initiation factor 2B subunit (eIF-2B alpha/beta/delta family)